MAAKVDLGIAFFFSFLLLIAAGCQQVSKPTAPAQTSPAASQAWDAYVNEFLNAYFAAHPDTAVIAGRHQFDGAHPERTRKVIQRHDRRIAPTTLEATDILLGDAGHLGEALLGEALRQPQPCKISANQPAHVHARKLTEYTLSGLSPIMCI